MRYFPCHGLNQASLVWKVENYLGWFKQREVYSEDCQSEKWMKSIKMQGLNARDGGYFWMKVIN